MSDKNSKGLRHFSMKVCQKVESKGNTTYNEVADELVTEFSKMGSSSQDSDNFSYDEKNIRRRVYDAINVLMAMGIITKVKKEIKWNGFPTSNDYDLKMEKKDIISRMSKKAAYLKELEDQILAIKKLIVQNKMLYKETKNKMKFSALSLPFILVQTEPQAMVEVEISDDMELIHFDFNTTPFELHDDGFVLRAMGLCNSHDDNHNAHDADMKLHGGSQNIMHKIPSNVPMHNVPVHNVMAYNNQIHNDQHTSYSNQCIQDL